MNDKMHELIVSAFLCFLATVLAIVVPATVPLAS